MYAIDFIYIRLSVARGDIVHTWWILFIWLNHKCSPFGVFGSINWNRMETHKWIMMIRAYTVSVYIVCVCVCDCVPHIWILSLCYHHKNQILRSSSLPKTEQQQQQKEQRICRSFFSSFFFIPYSFILCNSISTS